MALHLWGRLGRVVCGLVCIWGLWGGEVAAEADVRLSTVPADRYGVTHTSGKYFFGEQDFLNEGAARLEELGTKTIKLWFTKFDTSYPHNSHWEKFGTMTEAAKSPMFREVFARGFNTYVLVAFAQGVEASSWKDGLSAAEAAVHEAEFYELTKYLLTEYAGTGKTFVLQNWEGDWAVREKSDLAIDPTPVALAAMVEWINARQRGVDRARAEVGTNGVWVWHALEMNQVRIAMEEGRVAVVKDVLPFTNVDLASYSCYDTQQKPEKLKAALQYIAKHMPAKQGIDGVRVYLGEYGLPETNVGQEKLARMMTAAADVADEFGCPYLIYWQLYCNEPIRTPVVQNGDAKGYWLIRPDGSKAWTWDFHARRVKGLK